MEGIGGGRGEMCDGCFEMYAVSRGSSRFLFRARFDEMDLAGFFFFFSFFFHARRGCVIRIVYVSDVFVKRKGNGRGRDEIELKLKINI